MKKIIKKNSLMISLTFYALVGFLAGGSSDE